MKSAEERKAWESLPGWKKFCEQPEKPAETLRVNNMIMCGISMRHGRLCTFGIKEGAEEPEYGIALGKYYFSIEACKKCYLLRAWRKKTLTLVCRIPCSTDDDIERVMLNIASFSYRDAVQYENVNAFYHFALAKDDEEYYQAAMYKVPLSTAELVAT